MKALTARELAAHWRFADMYRHPRLVGGWTFVDCFCGAGGSAIGLTAAGGNLLLAANHNQVCIDTHAANFTRAEHLCADLNHYDMRRLPDADMLWASPICWEGSPAGGRMRRHRKRQAPGQGDLLEEYGPIAPDTWERTRLTAYDVLRAAEVHDYPVVLCENVVEFATDWPMFGWWLAGMRRLGYRHRIVCVSSAHVGGDGIPYAPQWRDRLYVVFVREGLPLPDLTPRPLALCVECGQDVPAVQWWKDPRRPRLGKYRQQYLYRCPNTGCRNAVVEPYVAPAASVIDWSDLGRRIGDRKRPLAASTMRRIRAGLQLFTGQHHIVTVNHGGHDVRAYPPHAAPLATRTAKIGDGLLTPPMLVPAGGTWNDTATVFDQPMRTRLVRDMEALVTPPGAFVAELRRNGTARSIADPLAIITARGTHHALVVPYYRTGVAKSAGTPFETVTTRDRFALVTGQTVEVDDCHLRMVQPRESLAAQVFPDDYTVTGNKGEQTAQAGNAVSANVAQWLGRQCAAILNGSAA